MPDGAIPSSTEALRAALAVAQASLESQLSVAPSKAAETALHQLQRAIQLLPSGRALDIQDAVWIEADATPPTPAGCDQTIRENTDARDDLTRIRGIDEALSKRLAALGIHRYVQIAAWELDDVRIIADAMGLGRRFLAMGIVEQAIELERQKHEAEKPRASAAGATADRSSIAVWTPTPSLPTSPPTPPSHESWKPLSPDERRRVRSIIRSRQPLNRIVTLVELAPVLGTPIYVASDYDHSVELPRWRTGVLVPFVEPPAAPDLARLGAKSAHPSAPAPTPEPRRIIIAAPLPEVRPAPEPPHPTLYEQATSRIADLEAALDVLSTESAAPLREDAPIMTRQLPASATVAPRLRPDNSERFDRHADLSRAIDEVEEAEVLIVTKTRPPATMLQPLPALPFAPSRGGRFDHRPPAPSMAVEEAAVVIVRRTGPARDAGDLAFYKTAAEVKPGPVRRFMRALAGA